MERWRLSRSTVAQGPPKTTKDHRGLQSNNAFKANWAARTYRGYVGKITSHYHRHHHDCFNHPCYHHHLRNHHQGQLSTSRTPKGYVGCRKNMFSDFGTNTFVGFCLLARARGLFKNMPVKPWHHSSPVSLCVLSALLTLKVVVSSSKFFSFLFRVVNRIQDSKSSGNCCNLVHQLLILFRNLKFCCFLFSLL